MGKPGARLTDMTAHGGTIMGPGVPTVMTGKMPAATILDQHVCPMVTGVVPHVGGPATLASTGVLIGKKPAARMGDLHVCVGPPSMPVMGCFTVLIGEAGGGGGGGAGSAAAAAAANTKSPASVEPFPLAEPPAATELHYCQFKFVDSAGKGLGGIPYVFTGPDKVERTGCSAPEGEAYYSGLAKGGSFKVKAGAVTDAKWSKAKATLDDEMELTAKADGLADGTPAILTVLERSNTGLQRFLHKADCKVEGKKIKAKWKVDLGSDDTPSPKETAQRSEFTYQFIAYAAGGVAVSDKLQLESDLEIEVLDEIEQPIADKPVEVLLTNGEVKTGKLDAKGKFKVGKVPAKPASVSLKVPGVYRGSLAGMYFDPGKCFLLAGSIGNFQQITQFYFDHPDFNLLIVGHTDRVGDVKSNLDLSIARAEAVAAYLKDDVSAWEAWYGGSKPIKTRWGILEDKHMLKALQDGGTPFLTGVANGKADKEYTAAVKHFQTWCNGKGLSLKANGIADAATRKELIKRYMALDGVSLPKTVNVATHGCGESHNLYPSADGAPDTRNRRVEIYFFEGDITPKPVATCPTGGCTEWAKWHNATTNLLDMAPSTSGGIERNEFTQSMLDCFGAVDRNKDGILDPEEIKKAVGDNNFKGQHGAMLAVLYVMLNEDKRPHYEKFIELSDDQEKRKDDGFSLADIDALDRLRAADKSNELVAWINTYYQYSLAKIKDPLRSPYASSGRLNPFSMRQGMIGDCWFLAAMVALADKRPDEIKSMIKANGGGTFTVNFPGHANPITIIAPSDGEIALFASTVGDGVWPTILEKAYGTSVYTAPYTMRKSGAAEGADGGDIPAKGIKILSGHSASALKIDLLTWNSTVKEKIKTAIAAKKLVTASVGPKYWRWQDEHNTSDGLPRSHAYSVLEYKSTADTVLVRNPWGSVSYKNVAGTYGIFEAKLDDFCDNFSFLYYED